MSEEQWGKRTRMSDGMVSEASFESCLWQDERTAFSCDEMSGALQKQLGIYRTNVSMQESYACCDFFRTVQLMRHANLGSKSLPHWGSLLAPLGACNSAAWMTPAISQRSLLRGSPPIAVSSSSPSIFACTYEPYRIEAGFCVPHCP